MALVSDYLDPGCVASGLDASSSTEAITTLVGLLAGAGKLKDERKLLGDVLARERLTPTGLEEGCAVPHAQSDALESTAIAVATFKNPVDFGAPDGRGATLVFLLAGPKNCAGLHLKLLSKLARFMHDPAFRDAAKAARDADALTSLIRERDE